MINLSLENQFFKNQRVFLRADLNISDISLDHKLTAISPTIDFILKKGGIITLATHIGRPESKGKPCKAKPCKDESLSTKKLMPWFKDHGYDIKFSEENTDASITLLENLRFHRGETNHSRSFAEKLSKLGDIYINDAFGCIHRDDTSITLLPELFPQDKKAFGLLVEKELDTLNSLKQPKQPFILVLGGNKTKDKIPFIKKLMSLEKKPKSILIGGAMAYTFLKSQGINVGKSLVEEDSLDLARSIIQESYNQDVKIILPKDSLVIENNQIKNVPINKFPSDAIGVDIGRTTIESFTKKIESAKTIFVNGTMGIYTNPLYAEGTKSILKAISKSHSFSVIGGGDAVASTYMFHTKKIDFLSTGGGATLKYLSISEDEYTKLPAVAAILTK